MHTLTPLLKRTVWLALGLPATALLTAFGPAARAAAPAPETVPLAEAALQTLSLEQLTDIVLAHNAELAAARQGRATAMAGVRSATALPNPRLEWSQGRNQARLPSATPGAAGSWGVSQFIENPSARDARLDAARATERGSEQLIALTRNTLVAQVRLKAYEYLLRRAEAVAARDAVVLLEQVRERVRLRVESGEAARYEIIKADAEIINARQREQTAQLQAEQTLLGLNRLAAGKLPQRWTLSGQLSEEAALPPLDELQRQAEALNPELHALQTEVDRAQAQLAGARASRWPGVELRYGQTREPEVRQQMLGVSVQIPLLDTRSGPIAEASSELERLRTRLDGRQAELRQQVLQAWKSLEMARGRVDALSQGAMREAEAALRVAQAAYRFGERGILDVLDAQRVLRSVRADLLEARFQVQAARIELDYLAGRFSRQP